MCVFCTLKKKKKNIYLKDISKKRAKINLHCQLPPTVLSKEFSPLPSPGPPQLSSSATACCWGCHSGDKLDPAQETSPPSQASHLLAAHIPQGFVLPDHALLTVRHVTGSRFRQCVTQGLAGSFHSNGHLKQQHKGRQRMTPIPGAHSSPDETDKCERAAKRQRGCFSDSPFPPSPGHPPSAPSLCTSPATASGWRWPCCC